jgi:hypothetical protein
MNNWGSDFEDWMIDLFETNIDVQKVLLASYEKRKDDYIPVLTLGSANAYFQSRQDAGDEPPFMGWGALLQKGGYPFAESRLNAAPNPATGETMRDTTQAVLAGVIVAMQARARRAWANGETPDELISALVGKGVNGLVSELDKTVNHINGMIDTVIQQSTMTGNRMVQSAISDRYQWVSVMDGRTTEICRSRNLRVYEYGRGPLPPAHIRCRSHIAPYLSSDPMEDIGFYQWAMTQPMAFMARVYPRTTAESFANGTARAEDHARYSATRPMTLQEYSRSANITLS